MSRELVFIGDLVVFEFKLDLELVFKIEFSDILLDNLELILLVLDSLLKTFSFGAFVFFTDTCVELAVVLLLLFVTEELLVTLFVFEALF